MLNVEEPETKIPIHRHLEHKVKVYIYNSKGKMDNYAFLCREKWNDWREDSVKHIACHNALS